ncbi:muts domain V-domain-containing protein [Zopfochytrium polystomum]|nr:muts domain V-domain-containing protein [Zopfochytrium polystomum]
MDSPSGNAGARSGPEVSVDKSTEIAFCNFFRGMDEKPENTVRLFERAGGDYFTAHGDDALYVAETVFKTSTVIKYWGVGSCAGSSGVPYCSISKLNTMALVRDLLLVKQKRVEIWEAEGRKGLFRLGRKASPGHLHDVEDMIFANSSQIFTSPVVLAAKPGNIGDQKMIGIAYTDATTMHRIGVAEFVENDTFSNFESLLVQLSVRECVLPEDSTSYEIKKMQSILDRCGIVVTKRKRVQFDPKDIEQDLNRLLADGIMINSLREFDYRLAMGATAGLIKYLDLLGDESNYAQYQIESYDLSQYMRLDAAAVKALNLMPSGAEGSNKNMSLYGLLNKTKTSQGARLLAQWLKQPLMNLNEIEARLNLVEAFTQDTELRQTLQEVHLKRFPDLHRMGKKFLRGKANLQDVLRVYQVAISLAGFIRSLQEYDSVHKTLIQEMYIAKLLEYSSGLAKLQEMVETTVDIEAAENHEYIIRADFDDDLRGRTGKSTTLKFRFLKTLQVADDLGVELDKKLKLEQNPQHGWHLRLTKSDAAKIRNRREYQELSTLKAGVLFTTNRLKRLSSEIEELRGKYEEIQSNLVREIVTITAGYFPLFERLNMVVAHLDVIVSFADVTVHAPVPLARPKLCKKGESDVILKSSRHPCLEVQDGVSFIANDVEMLRASSKFQIITGPNMGGKSTYIRQIGVIALMAQSGCFVPCESAQLPVFDSILARVGAGDSQLKGVSTFMAEMLETASILRTATKDSLIIIDELGRGTSTYDGFGLAWAISEHISTKLNCFALFATHFHELTTLADKVPTVKNLHVTAKTDRHSIALLYRVREGVCDQSFGIHVAELAAFPEAVVRLAKRKAAELEDFEGQDASPSKVPKAVVLEADGVIQAFLSEFKTLAQQAQARGKWPAESLTIIQGLKEKYAGRVESSEFLKGLVETVG